MSRNSYRKKNHLAHASKFLPLGTLYMLRSRGEGTQPCCIQYLSTTTADSLDSEATVLIPDELESLETLRFQGFDNIPAAVHIFFIFFIH
jgi:hypothetical protein